MTIDQENPVLIEMKRLHQTISTNEEGIPFYPLSSNFHLIMKEATTEEWYVWGPQTKGTFQQDSRSIPESRKKDMVDIINEWNEIAGRENNTEPLDNLKDGGFDLEADQKQDVEETKVETARIKEETEKLITNEKEAKINERKANEKRLAMMEQAEQEEETHSVSSKPSGSIQKTPTENPIFTDRPVEYVDSPAAKVGEVNLFNLLMKLCKHDLMQVFGPTGTGKTSLCTKLAIDARTSGKSVLYIDTEGSINDDQIAAMKKTGTKYELIKQFSKLCEAVKRLPKVDVLIIDSAGVPALAAYCKANLGGQGEILKKFIAMSDDLKTYASDNNSLVVVINQPESSMGKGEDAILEPFGEKSRYYYKEILKTNYAKRGRRTEKTTLVLRAHRSRCMGIDTDICTMEITNNGITVIQ